MAVHFTVEESTPVQVVWTRGTKTAKTKKRLLNGNVPDAIIDEKFQIVTMFEVNLETGKPCKEKMSFLSVMTDKTATKDGKGLLGKVELDISQYAEGEFRIHKLKLKDTNDEVVEGAFIEVGIKGEESTSKPSSRSSVPQSSN